MTIARLTPSIAAPDEASVPTGTRVRASRLAVPRVITELTPRDDSSREGVNIFVDRLAELPAPEWVRIGRIVASDAAAVPVRRRAWTIVDEAITTLCFAVTAWCIRDAVETAACLASRTAPEWSRDGRLMFAATHGAAEAAALALLVRAHVDRDSVGVLCAPFGALVGSAVPNAKSPTQ